MKPTTAIFSALLIFSFSAAAANPGMPDKNTREEAVCGMVMDMNSKKSLKDVNVTAVLNSGNEKVALTDRNGGYRFVMLKPGTYKLVFEKDGYKKVIKESVLVSGKVVLQINIELAGSVSFPERGPSAWYFFEY